MRHQNRGAARSMPHSVRRSVAQGVGVGHRLTLALRRSPERRASVVRGEDDAGVDAADAAQRPIGRPVGLVPDIRYRTAQRRIMAAMTFPVPLNLTDVKCRSHVALP